MKNLVFRFCLVVTLHWQLTAAERSANGYFYDKPEGISFEEAPGSVQLYAAPQSQQQVPQVEQVPQVQQVQQVQEVQQVQQIPETLTTSYLQQQLPPSLPSAGESNLQIIPATLVYEDIKTIDSALRPSKQIAQDSVVNFIQPQQNYRTNLQPVAFTIQGANDGPQPCGVQPIVAQVNPALVNLSGGGPLTRVITTCGPNNNCNTITVQSDLNRHLGVQAGHGQQYRAPQQSFEATQQAFGAPQQSFGATQQSFGAPQQSFGAPQQSFGATQQSFGPPQARSAPDNSFLLLRPPNRRLVEYSEIEHDDPYN